MKTGLSLLWQNDPFASEVESWLDNHPTFLWDYIRLKSVNVTDFMLMSESHEDDDDDDVDDVDDEVNEENEEGEQENIHQDDKKEIKESDESVVVLVKEEKNNQNRCLPPRRSKMGLPVGGIARSRICDSCDSLQWLQTTSTSLISNSSTVTCSTSGTPTTTTTTTRSGTDTPVRKISSHDFDCVGSRPILTTNADGSVTFISPFNNNSTTAIPTPMCVDAMTSPLSIPSSGNSCPLLLNSTSNSSSINNNNTMTSMMSVITETDGLSSSSSSILTFNHSHSTPQQTATTTTLSNQQLHHHHHHQQQQQSNQEDQQQHQLINRSHHRKSRRRRSEMKTLDEREFMREIILDICNDLDISSLCFKILQNISLLLNADRCSLFLIGEDRDSGERILVSKLFDVTGDATLEETIEKCNKKKIIIPLGVGIMGYVAHTGQPLNIQNAYEDPRFNSDVDQQTGFTTRSILCMPLKDANDEVLGVAQAVNKSNAADEPFTEHDVKVFESYLAFCGIGLKNAQIFTQSQLETRRNQVLLDLARLIFVEQSDLNKLIHKIMMHTQSLLQCDRCQVLLLAEANNENQVCCERHSPLSQQSKQPMFSQVYDLSSTDNMDDELATSTLQGSARGRYPLNIGITGEVASRGITVNIRDAYEDSRFERCVDEVSKYRTKAILCMPIRDSRQQVIGVCQLVNKLDNSFFTKSDENLFEAFALFCGLGIHNGQMYDKAVRAMAKQRVALEVLSYHALAPHEEAIRLKKMLVPSVRFFKLTEFSFTDFSLSDDDTLRACLRMFIDLDVLRRFHISYTCLCRWLLSVKKNYRPVTYHNWRHAFNVAQTMFAIMKNSDLMKHLGLHKCLALLIACLCHDLDHRGTNNQFQIKTMSPLAELYSTSVMEHHHFDQCLMILNTKGCDILSRVRRDEYITIVDVIEKAILATDLARYFARREEMFRLVSRATTTVAAAGGITTSIDVKKLVTTTTVAAAGSIEKKDGLTIEQIRPHIQWDNEDHCELVCSMLMTGCDVAAITKPWPVQRKIAELVASEFFEQGDIEKTELNITPQEMMDRDKKDQLPRMQVDFIDGICMPVYKAIVQLSPSLNPLLEGCVDNRERWKNQSENTGSDHHS